MNKVLLAALIALAPGISQAQEPVQRLTQLLGSWQSLTTDFNQTVSNERGRVLDRSSGQFSLKRPSSFRWQVKQPFEQLILGVGSTLWSYEKELDQVTIQTTEGSLGEVPAFLLTQDSDIARSFQVTSYNFKQPDSGAMQEIFELKPKNPDNSLEQVNMTFQGERLLGMELLDAMGQRTRVLFSNSQVNPTLADSLFKFEPPKGVDVIDNRASSKKP